MEFAPRHSLLKRQLKKLFADAPITEELIPVLAAVDQAYQQFDDDRLMLERSLDLSSEALFTANSELRSLFVALPDLVLRVRGDGTVVDVKSGSDADLLVGATDLVGLRLQDAPIRSGDRGFAEVLEEVRRGGSDTSFEYEMEVRGNLKAYEARVVPFIGRQVLVVIRDITDLRQALADLKETQALLEQRVAERTAELRDANEALRRQIAEREAEEEHRRKLEAKLLQAQKLESLGVLAGGIAHDFNNLLMAVLGNASLALDDVPPDSPLRHTLEEVLAAARRAAGLTNQMLAYWGRGTFEVESSDVSTIAEEMASLLEVSISKKARLVYEMAEGLPSVEADVTQIGQVVMNLITNASDALGEHEGTIHLRTGTQLVDRKYLAECLLGDEVSEGDYVFVEVEDDGSGMDGPTRERIFDPFFTTKFTGRGLGLAAVVGIVRAHGGAIHVSSHLGEGTTIRVILPSTGMPRAAELAAATGEAEAPPAQSATILVVDDDRGVRRVLESILQRGGYQVLTASDGREGVETFSRHLGDVACIILDMTMPVMDGPEAFREIRRLSATVPVVLISGYAPEEVAKSVGRGDHLALIQKPFAARDLLAGVRELTADTSEVP
jgi:signal transduction histidine kinase/ActR/RegA family two-component response regulator